MRIGAALLMCMGLVTTAADDPMVTADETKRLQTAGYRDATIVLDPLLSRAAISKAR